MTVDEFITLTAATRAAQQTYYGVSKKYPDVKRKALEKSLALEAQLDAALKTIRKDNQKDLQSRLFQ